MDPVFLIVGGIIHTLMVSVCFMVSKETFNRLESKWIVYSVIILLPIVNLMLTLLLMDTTIMVYKRNLRDKSYKIDDLNLELSNEKARYNELERKIFRKVRVGDTFVIPNNDGYVTACRGKKCIITDIVGNGVRHSVDGSTDTYITKWELLKEMVFLSDEPFKPFEFK